MSHSTSSDGPPMVPPDGKPHDTCSNSGNLSTLVDELSRFNFADSVEDEFISEPEQSTVNDTEPISENQGDTLKAVFNESTLSMKFSPLFPRRPKFHEKRHLAWIQKHLSPFPVKLKERHYKKLRRICFQGLPSTSRSQVWFLLVSRLSTTPIVSRAGGSDVAASNLRDGKFDAYLMDLCRSYASVYPNPKWSDLILKDLRRCITDDERFNNANGIGYKALNKVLFAFSVHNSDVGYCQGLGPLVAFILSVFNGDKSELGNSDNTSAWEWEKAYWVLHYLNSDNRYMRDYNTPGLTGVIVDMWLFGEMVKKYLPKQHRVLANFGFEPNLYAQAWFFLLFARTLPHEICVRIWDMYLCEGKFVMFKAAILLVYIVCHKCKEIIREEDIEKFLNCLQHPDPKWFKTEKFIDKINKFRIDSKSKRKFLEQAERYRYEQFGAIHTITSQAPEMADDVYVGGAGSEVDSTLTDTDNEMDFESCKSAIFDNDYSCMNFTTSSVVADSHNLKSSDSSYQTLHNLQCNNTNDDDRDTIGGCLHVDVGGYDNDHLSETSSSPHFDVVRSSQIAKSHDQHYSTAKDLDDSSPRSSPVALSACSSSTSEHKEQMTSSFTTPTEPSTPTIKYTMIQ